MTAITRNLPPVVKDFGVSIVGKVRTHQRNLIFLLILTVVEML